MALALGNGTFEGILYPSMIDLGQALYVDANIPLSVFNERLRRIIPQEPNVVLLFSGNTKLTTSASALAGDEAPNSVKQDAILKGIPVLYVWV